MTKLGRNGLEATDPVTVEKFTAQFDHLKTGLDNRLIDEENFYSDSFEKIRSVSDAITDSKLFEGKTISVDDASSGTDLKVAVDKMVGLLDYEYTVVSKRFNFSLSINGIKTEEEDLDGEDFVSGLATIGSFTAAGAGVGAAIGGGVFSIPAAGVGAIIGGTIGIATVASTWIWGDKPKKEVGQKLNQVNTIAVDIPFGFVYEEHSITGTHDAFVATDEFVVPILVKRGSNSARLYFQVTSRSEGSFTSDEFYNFNGTLQILLKRKL